MLKFNTLDILAYARTLISQILKYVLGSSNGTVINDTVLKMYPRLMDHKKMFGGKLWKFGEYTYIKKYQT
jgi:hypothetical protein